MSRIPFPAAAAAGVFSQRERGGEIFLETWIGGNIEQVGRGGDLQGVWLSSPAGQQGTAAAGSTACILVPLWGLIWARLVLGR